MLIYEYIEHYCILKKVLAQRGEHFVFSEICYKLRRHAGVK